MFIPPNLEPRTPAVRAGALSAGEEDVRRCARLRELDSDESEWTRVERNGCGVNSITGSGGCGFSRVVEEDESVEDLVAVRLVVVLEPHATVRTEVLVGQAALGHCEERQTAQQDREVHPEAPEIFQAVELGCITAANTRDSPFRGLTLRLRTKPYRKMTMRGRRPTRFVTGSCLRPSKSRR